jgi:uncharacterized protein (TIGR02145 family)
MDAKRSLSIIAILFFIAACNDDNQPEVTPIENITISGKEYPTVKIGTQTWTSVNYDGPGGVSYDATNSKPQYGKYYSKLELAAITLPEGWRIPTQEDYTKLAEHHGISLPSHGTHTTAVKTLTSTTYWNHVPGTNTSGFNAYPAGYAFGDMFPDDGDIAEFWTSEGITLSIQEGGADLASLRMVFYDSSNSPDFKFNVRFVKD